MQVTKQDRSAAYVEKTARSRGESTKSLIARLAEKSADTENTNTGEVPNGLASPGQPHAPLLVSLTANGKWIGRKLRQPEVEMITGVKRKSMYALIARGKFPAGKPLWEGSTAVGWSGADIAAFLNGTWQPPQI